MIERGTHHRLRPAPQTRAHPLRAGMAAFAGCVCVIAATPDAAQGADRTAQASAVLVTPIDIVGVGDLTFGAVAAPRAATCVYDVTATGQTTASGGSECRFLSGAPLPAEFTVACSGDQLVTYEVLYASAAPSGVTFSAPTTPMAIDGFGAGPALQTRACDSDGLSDVKAGGRLTVTPAAPDAFDGVVGSIRLEAQYE